LRPATLELECWKTSISLAAKVDTVIGTADSADALRDLRTLGAEALARVTRSLQRVFDLP
jgi:hypothetical protein